MARALRVILKVARDALAHAKAIEPLPRVLRRPSAILFYIVAIDAVTSRRRLQHADVRRQELRRLDDTLGLCRQVTSRHLAH